MKQWGGHNKRAVHNLQIWPDFGSGAYGRAACYDYQASGAYGEVYANNTCILSGYQQQPWCNSTGCGVANFRDVCPTKCSNLRSATFALLAANNTYFVQAGAVGAASWRSSDQSCALPLSAVQMRGRSRGAKRWIRPRWALRRCSLRLRHSCGDDEWRQGVGSMG